MSKPSLSTRWLRAALCALVLAAYCNSFQLGLAVDGRVIVTSDARIRTVSVESLRQILTHDYWWPVSADRLYRPVTLLSFLFNYAVMGAGTSAAIYHWTNFLLHAMNVLLVFELAFLIFRAREPAFWAAALWAVHPIHTEAVTYVAGRADLLAGMSLLGGLLLYARSVEWTGRRLYRGAALLFVIATLGEFSKENAAALIGLMLLWDISFEGFSRARRWPMYGAVCAALALFFAMRAWIFSALPWPETPFVANPLIGAGFWQARLTAIKVLGLDLRLLIFPLNLSADRSYRQIPVSGWADPLVWTALAAIVAILAIAAVRRRRDPVIFWAAGLMGITLLPASNLIVLIGTIMAERVLYIPCVGFCVAVVALAFRVKHRRAVQIALGAVIALWIGRTLARNPAWNSDLELAQATVESAPQSFGAHDRLAGALFQQDPKRNLDRAIEQGEIAWRILSELPPARRYQQTAANLGAFYRAKGDDVGGPGTPQGRAWYEKSLAVLEEGRETARAVERNFDAAQTAHGRPLIRRVAFRDLYFNLGAVNASLGRYAEALEAYRYGRILDPSSADPYDEIAAVFRASGNPEWAAITLHEKGQLDGYQPQTMSALAQLYSAIPGASCALNMQGAEVTVDFHCPRVQSDVCRGLDDLAQAFRDARDPAKASRWERIGAERYQCGAPPR